MLMLSLQLRIFQCVLVFTPTLQILRQILRVFRQVCVVLFLQCLMCMRLLAVPIKVGSEGLERIMNVVAHVSVKRLVFFSQQVCTQAGSFLGT